MEKSLLTPKAKPFFSTKSNTHIVPEVVDLSQPGCGEKIVSREDPANRGFADPDKM